MSEAETGTSEQEILQALNALRDEPYGAARSARTEELVEQAEQAELDRALIIAMFELLTAYEYGAETHKAPVLFSRILKLYTDKPEAFDEWAEHRVFWCFKWITSSLLDIPDVPLTTIEGWITQMQGHYRAADKPLQAVRTSRFHLAAHTGTGVQEAYESWATRPRDEFSDCEACEARNRGKYWAARHDDVRALKEWAPVLAGELTCAEEPAATIGEALLPLVRAGRADEAVSLHRSGYRTTKGRVSMDSAVARHLEFLALTGNGARGLELLAENRHRFASTATPLTRLSFLRGVRVLLGRLVAEGNGQVPVSGPDGRTPTAAELLAEVAAQTEDLARRFDARNGTTLQSDKLHAWCGQEPVTAQPLELGLRTAPLPVTAPPPAPASLTPLPDEFAALLAEAREAQETGRPDRHRLWEAVEQRASETDLEDPVLRAELAGREAWSLTLEKRWQEAEQRHRAAADLFDLAGQPGRAAVRRARAVWAGFGEVPDTAQASWDELDGLTALAERLLAAGEMDKDDYCVVLHCRVACALVAAGGRTGTRDSGSEAEDEDDDARDGFQAADPAARERVERELDRFREAAARLALPYREAVAKAIAARAAESDGRIEDALALIEDAVHTAERAGRPWAMPEFLTPAGHLHNRLRRLEPAADRLHRALALSTEWPEPEANLGGLLMELAWNRLNAGDPAAAIGHLTAAASRFDRQRRARSAVTARCMLGQALASTGRSMDAIAVYESVLDEEAEARLSASERGQLRLDLGRALMRAGEYKQAAEVFVGLADFVAQWPDQRICTMVGCELAGALFCAGLLEQARAAVERVRQLHAQAPNAGAVCGMLRQAANGTMEAEGARGAQQALAYLEEADAVAAATEERPDGFQRWPETAQTADLRTQILASLERYEPALAAAEAAAVAWERGGLRTIDEWAESVRVAAVIEGFRLGRREQAVARIGPALERCRAAGRDRAVTILTQLVGNLRKN